MDMTTSAEQDEIIESTRSFLARRQPITRIREFLDSPVKVDDAVWAEAAGLGWLAIGLPESAGGVGFGLVDESLLFREIGRGLALGPWLSTVLAVRVAVAAGDERLAGSIMDGSEKVGLVVGSPIDGVTRLLDADGSYALSIDEDRAAIIDLSSASGVTMVGCVDPASTLRRADVSRARVVAAVAADVDPIARRARVLASAMFCGMSEAVRDIAAQHAINRVQFDKHIGVNQAVKHPCADMAVRSELAYAQMLFAALAHDEGRADADLQALNALVSSCSAAIVGGDATVQVLGGMGFTFEADAHLYVKRAKVLSHVLDGMLPAHRRVLSLQPAD